MPNQNYTHLYARLGKRAFDILIVCGLTPVWVPLFLLTAGVGAIEFGGALFFTQLRPGKHGKVFRVVKFRTMHNLHDAHGNLLPDAQRTPQIGRFLRRTSLDELPQLFLVLAGKMSLVGPRPLLPEYLPLYSERQQLRHTVLPGITGLAQVSGRNALDWPTRLALDVEYAEKVSLGLDLKILVLTVAKAWRARGGQGEHPGFFKGES